MKVKSFALAMVLVMGLAGVAMAADAPAAAPEGAPAPPPIVYGTNVGDNVKPVSISSLDGKSTIAVDKLNKKTIFIMISSVCTACRKEYQEISENISKFEGKADIYGVIIDMDPAAAAARIGAVPFPTLADPEYKLGNAVGMLSTPSTVIVKDGKILFAQQGYRPGQWKEYLR
jgi:peroxiredoxin